MSFMKNYFSLSNGERITTFQKLATFALLLYPIFQTYGVPGLNSSIAYVFTALLGTVCFLRKLSGQSTRRKIDGVPKYLLIYFAYAIVSRVFTVGTLNFVPIDLILLLFFAYLYFENINFTFFYRLYRLVALVCIVFFWIQEVSYYTTGWRPSGIISGLTIIISQESTSSFINILSYLNERSSSFFSEPAHFVQFLLPLLCLELFGPDKNIFRAGVIAVTLLFLRSGNAVLGLAVISFVYVMQLFKGNMKMHQKILVLIVVIAAGYGGVRFAETEDGQRLLSRQEEVTDSLMGSGFVRIYRGYWLYGDFNFFEKLVGVNNKETLEAHIRRLPSWVFSYGSHDYFNGVQYLLIHTGLIGAIIFILVYINLWKNNDLCGRSCLLTCIALSFIAGIHLNSFMFTCLLIAIFRQKDLLNKRRLKGIYESVANRAIA